MLQVTAEFEKAKSMKLGMVLGYSGADMASPMERVLEAERLGFDSVWSSEAYGSDAVSPAAWVLARTTRIKAGTAIMQMPARTPAMTAMTAMTLDALSGGRFLLGIGPSGPQVVEGWYGVAYGKPLVRITQLEGPKRPIRFGVLKGQVSVAADFDAPLAKDVLTGFEGR